VNFRELLRREAGLSENQLDQLARHYELLVRWNKSLNLTRIGELSEVVKLHYLESIVLARALPAGSLRIADVGSGGGFPGVPVAVVRPESTVSLIESHKRKAVFLSEVASELLNVDVLAARAETVQGSYDWIIARAVRPEEILNLALSQNFALLTTVASLTNLPAPVSIERLPWGDQRVLAMFHVERGRIDPWLK
jgi:16S rRNA (guanine527-N7)-methyltransferase